MPLAPRQCTTFRPVPVLVWAGAMLLAGLPRAHAAYENIEILYEQGAGEQGLPGVGFWVTGILVVGLLMTLVQLQRRYRQRLGQLHDALERSRHRLQEAQSIARIGSWDRNFDTGETFWSEEACKMLGLERSRTDHKHYERLIHPDDLERVTEVVASAYYQGGSYQCDHRVICPGGVEKYIRLSGQVFMGDDKTPVRETGTVQDITQQYQADRAIQRSEQRLRMILDATPYPILMLENTDSLALLYANRATYTLFRLDPGLAFDDIRLQDGCVDPAELMTFTQAVAQQGAVLAREILLKDTDGRHFWGELSGNRLDYSGIDALFVTLTDISEQRRLRAEMERLATTDTLTGALNRRSFLEAAQRELRRSVRYRHPFTLILMDIDHFKRINDRYGHLFGDEVIRRFSEVARGCLREEDLLGRIGGEEFAAILVSSEEGGGYLVAERIRKRWQEEAFEFRGARSNFTVSVGVAQLLSDQDSMEAVMERADRGLYDAKRAGRNCVIVYNGDRAGELRQQRPL